MHAFKQAMVHVNQARFFEKIKGIAFVFAVVWSFLMNIIARNLFRDSDDFSKTSHCNF